MHIYSSILFHKSHCIRTDLISFVVHRMGASFQFVFRLSKARAELLLLVKMSTQYALFRLWKTNCRQWTRCATQMWNSAALDIPLHNQKHMLELTLTADIYCRALAIRSQCLEDKTWERKLCQGMNTRRGINLTGSSSFLLPRTWTYIYIYVYIYIAI